MMKTVCRFVGVLCLLMVAASWQVSGQERESYGVRPVYGGFEVEVLVGGVPLEKLFGRGRTYVEAIEGAEYELRIRNPLPVRVAVALSVDGLNTVDARRTSSWDATKWVIEPYGTLRVGGWQMSRERARRFYFTTERDSSAAKLGRASDLGLIAAVFYREAGPAVTYRRRPPYRVEEMDERGAHESRTENAPAPSSAQTDKKRSGRSATTGEAIRPDDDYAATGIGRSVTNNVERIHMELERRPAAELSIRYEYRPALVKLGILPRPRPYPDPLPRRERARGFEDPGFCPEP